LPDAWLIAGLLVGTILTRWPFQASILDSFDAVNYALAIEHFDMRLAQPQAPGYPLYIVLGRAFNLIFQDHLTALVWLSALFSGLAVIAIYLAGKEMFGRRAGIIAALFLGSSTLFWYVGEIAAPYAVDIFGSAMVGWLCYRLTRSPRRGAIWVTAVALGLAGALRLQTLIFLFPLFLYAIRRHSWREIAGAIAVAGIIFGSFFGPAIAASGGATAFINSMQVVVPIVSSTKAMARSASLARFVKNGVTILRYLLTALGELVGLLAILGYLTRPNPVKFWKDPQLRFLIIWLLPTWAVYLIIWPGNAGTIMVCTPPLFLLAAAGINRVMERSRQGRIAAGIAISVTLVWHILIFAVLPTHPFGEQYRRYINYAELRHTTETFQTKLSLVADLPAEHTIAYAHNFRYLQYYLPAYHTFSLPQLDNTNSKTIRSIMSIQAGIVEEWADIHMNTLIPSGTERIIWFDLPTDRLNAPSEWIEEKTSQGHTIQVVSIPEGAIALWTPDGLLIHPDN